MKKERIKTIRHGMYGTRQYSIWSGIKRRCYNKNDISYKRYGNKGVIMCEEWKTSFLSFWNDMKDTYFDKAQIDRIDNNKGYYKENCRWVTIKEQANNKSNVILYEHNGKKMSCRDWDKYLGLRSGTVRARIKDYGWDIEKALTTKKQKPSYIYFIKSKNKYRVEINHKTILYTNDINEARKIRDNILSRSNQKR